jgi:hypothetical protein
MRLLEQLFVMDPAQGEVHTGDRLHG